MSDAVQQNRQAQVLRHSLRNTLLVWTAVYLAIFLLACLAFETFLKDELATHVADLTSDYYAFDEEGAKAFIEHSTTPNAYFQVYQNENGVTIVRDLSTYYFIRSLKWPLAIALFFVGYTIIVSRLLAKSVGYFTELSDAVEGIVRNREASIKLSPELAIARGGN